MKARVASIATQAVLSTLVIAAIGAKIVYSDATTDGRRSTSASESAFVTSCSALALEGVGILERAQEVHSSPAILQAIAAFAEGFPSCAAHPTSVQRAADCVAAEAATLETAMKPLLEAWPADGSVDVCARTPEEVSSAERAARALKARAEDLEVDSEVTQTCIGQVSRWLDSRAAACAETGDPGACLQLLEAAIDEYNSDLVQAAETGIQTNALIRDLAKTSGRVQSIGVMFAIRCSEDG